MAMSVSISRPIFLTLAEKQGATVPLMVGHRNMVLPCFVRETSHKAVCTTIGHSRFTILPTSSRWRAAFSADVRVVLLSYRSWALWLLGLPDAALTDSSDALKDARDGSNRHQLFGVNSSVAAYLRGDYAAAVPLLMKPLALADVKAHRSGRRTQ